MIEIDFSKFSPADQERLRSVQFGIDVENFLKSAVGQYLMAKSEAEREAALEELAQVPPEATGDIRRLQMIVHRCDSFGGWLAEAKIAAQNAEAELNGADE